MNPLTLQINNTSFHEGLFYNHQNDIVSDVLVGVIHICRDENKNGVKSLLWFLIPTPKNMRSKRKNMATNLQRLDAYAAMLEHLREERKESLSPFCVGFNDIACETGNEPWYNPIHTMETRLTHGMHSLPCSVVNCVRYIHQNCSKIGQEKSFKSLFVDKQEMVQDKFCEETVAMLHSAIETKILSVPTDENMAYADDVQRIKNHKMNLFTDDLIRNDLRRFLTFAYSSLQE